MRPDREIGRALADIRAEDEEDAQLVQRRAARAILRTIPNGTADEALTDEQRQAWKDIEAMREDQS